jgi:hypothetical protein
LYQLELLFLGDHFKYLLESVGAFSMARDINECPALKLLQETDALVDLHVVEQFLEEVVAVVVFD